MKKHFRTSALSLLLLTYLSLLAEAQKFTTSLSAPFQSDEFRNVVKSGGAFIAFEQTDNKMQMAYTFKLSKVKHGVKLVRYDASMKLVKENQLFDGERRFGPFPTQIKLINDKPFLLYYNYEDKPTSVLKIMAAEIDPLTLQLAPAKELFEIDQSNVGLFKTLGLAEHMLLVVEPSLDKTKVLAYWASGTNNEYFVSVMDSDLAPLWSKKVTEPAGWKVATHTATVDGSGVAYVSYRVSVEKADPLYRIAVCQPNGRVKTLDVKTREGAPHQVLLVPAKDNKTIHVAGTYASQPNCLTGVFVQTLSTTDFRLSPARSTAFSEALIEQLKEESWASTKTKNYGLNPLGMQAYELQDGSLAMAGEFRRTNHSEKGRSFAISGSILNVRFLGGAATIGLIPKARVSAGPQIGDSYFAFPYKDRLLVFYNDQNRNLQHELSKTPLRSDDYSKAVLAVAYMDAEGKVKREPLLDLVAEDFLPVGDAIIPLSSSSLLVPVRKIKGLGRVGDESKWGEIRIE